MADDRTPRPLACDPSIAATAPADPHAATDPTVRDPMIEIGEAAITLPAAGYQLGDLIGRGGMGEVIAAFDTRIGRDVAIKRMRSAKPDAQEVNRFLREARIQARLDHPAIVPVHELGVDADGRPFFTMKRLAGVTLGQRISDGTAQNRLLRALVDVCNAVELAHSRGVVHRDLKPANIMLGDYGEVYVLDWGVARVLAECARNPSTPEEIATLDDGTQAGVLLGTPGYMAPEQAKGTAATTAADVYALGAILFEILVREPLHPRGLAAIAHTLAEPQVMASVRRADLAVPPELELACHDALAENPALRPTARRLGERVQAYLDGDRDVERRRALAHDQLAAARDALTTDHRALAVQRAGRALALDPGSSEAAELVTKLIVEPPEQLPRELEASLSEVQQGYTRARMPLAVLAYSSPFVLWLLLPFLHIKSWSWIIAFYVAIGTTAVISAGMGRRGHANVAFLMISNLVVTVLWSRLAGPLVLTPVLVCGVLIAFASNPRLVQRPQLLLGWGVVAVLAPFVLEAIDLLPQTTQVSSGSLVSTSAMFEIDAWGYGTLIVANVIFVFVVGLYASYVGRLVAAAQRQLQVQAWHLQQLLPTTARA